MTSAVEQLRQEGKSHFQRGEFEEAISTYTKALVQAQDELTQLSLLLNRARCHLKLSQYLQVERDARKALNFNEDDFSATYLLGKALVKQNKFQEGIYKLKRAERLAGSRDQTNLVTQAHHAILDGIYQQWSIAEEVCKERDLILVEKIRSLKLTKEEAEEIVERLAQHHEHTTRRAVPEYMLCKITMVLMKDPVVAPSSGVTYERAALLMHLERNGGLDPVSRAPCPPADLIANLALKAAIDEFVEKNPWAALEWVE